VGTTKIVSISAGIPIAFFLIFFVFYYETGSDDAPLAQLIDPSSDDARLASIHVEYDDDTDRLRVAIYLTDSNAEDTKANGNAELSVFNENGREVYSAMYNFVKDDFVSWKNVFTGDKRTAYLITVNKFFTSSGGEVSGMMGYEVFVDLNLKEKHWEDLYDEFWSFE